MKLTETLRAFTTVFLFSAFSGAALEAAPAVEAPTPPEEAPNVSGLKDLRVLDRKLVNAVRKAAPATVSLVSAEGGGPQGVGSGVIVSEDGLILSAAHVIAGMPGEVMVLFPDGKRAKAHALGADFDRDAAMLQIDDEGPFPYVEIAKGSELPRNSWCLALGHPGGFDPMRSPPVRLGRVLRNEPFLITDCAVVGGDSGGPLFDVDGKLIGIHSNIGMTLSENRHVPISVYLDAWEDLKKGQRQGHRFAELAKELDKGGKEKNHADMGRAVLGLRLGEGSEDGVSVEAVMKKSPAAKAGLLKGDVVRKLNGKRFVAREDLIKTVSAMKPGERVKVLYVRDGKEKRADMKLARLVDLLPEGEKKGEKQSSGDDLQSYLDRKLADAKDGELRLELTPDQLEKFGGMEKLQAELQKRLRAPDFKRLPKGEEKEGKGKKEASGGGEVSGDLGDYLDRVFAGAKNGELRLELTPEQIEKFGGMETLQAELQKRVGSLGPGKFLEMAKAGALEPDEFFMSSMQALSTVTHRAARSTVEVLADGKVVALGTVVSPDGRIFTKNGETADGRITVRHMGEEISATLVKRFPKHDLALFSVKADGLKPISWRREKNKVPAGALLAVPGGDGEAAGIGVVSVQARALGEVGFLGVMLEEDAAGVRVGSAVEGGPAAKAGVRDGEVITALGGKKISDTFDFIQRIRNSHAGEIVSLTVLRDGKSKVIKVELAEREERAMSERFAKMNRMSGRLSEKRTGFPLVLQHDIPLDPEQCGGALLDLQGRCVGINVSRAGRVKTYAIPAVEVRRLLGVARGEQSVAQSGDARKPARPDARHGEGAKATGEIDLDAVREGLREVRAQLRVIEAQLDGKK